MGPQVWFSQEQEEVDEEGMKYSPVHSEATVLIMTDGIFQGRVPGTLFDIQRAIDAGKPLICIRASSRDDGIRGIARSSEDGESIRFYCSG